MRVRSFLCALACAWHFCLPSAHAYDYLLDDYTQLSIRLSRSLENLEFPSESSCRSIHQDYLALPRHGSDLDRLGEDIYEMKFAMSDWRTRTKAKLLLRLNSQSLSDDHVISHLNALRETQIQIHGSEIQNLQKTLPLSNASVARAFDSLLAAHGALGSDRASALKDAPEEILLEAGPLIAPAMRAEETREVHFSQWAGDPSFSHYENLSANSVSFRGIDFQSGDMVIVDEARPVAGFMPALFSPRQTTNHFGLFAIVKHGDKFVPVVYDFADTFRIIPLNLFLSEHFCTGAFVLRHREITPEKALAAAEVAHDYYQRKIAFNMEACETDQLAKGGNCGSLTLDYFRRMGVTWPTERSRVHGERLLENLSKVKFFQKQVFAPVNFLQSPLAQLVGVIDNGFFGTVVTRGLVNTYFKQVMSAQSVAVEKFPGALNRTVAAIAKMQTNTILGALARRAFAKEHSYETFPKGNALTLGAYRHHFMLLRRSERKTIAQFDCAWNLAEMAPAEGPVFSIHAFETAKGPFQQKVRKSMRPIEAHFESAR